MTYNDIRLLNESFQGLNDTLIRNRLLKEQRAERQASQQRMEQDAAAQAAYRQQDLAERNRHNTEDEKLRQHMIDLETTKAGTAKENADTAAMRGKKVFYFVSPRTSNVMSFVGTPDEAQAQFEKIQASKPNEQMAITDKEPESLRDLNEIKIDDQHTLHVSDAEAARYYSQKAATLAKAKTGGGPKETVIQHMNPRFFGTGQNVADPTQPEFISTTNTVTPLNMEVPQVPPMPNGAPTIQPQTPTVTSQDQYDALPSGSQYMDSSGNLRKKK